MEALEFRSPLAIPITFVRRSGGAEASAEDIAHRGAPRGEALNLVSVLIDDRKITVVGDELADKRAGRFQKTPARVFLGNYLMA
jgi:hypothetical protein